VIGVFPGRTVCRLRRRIRAERPDAGTASPLILLSFLLAATFVCASTAASAAFLAQRRLAAICDGAALAAANAFDRTAVTPRPADVLPLDDAGVRERVARYRQLIAGEEAPAMTVSSDGHTVTVECRHTTRLPFGAVLGRRDGLEQTVVARAHSSLG
jgi:hypothetical protein